MVLRNLITFCILGDSGISKESGTFSDYNQSDRSGDFGASGVGCEECKSKKQYEQISEYICIKETIWTEIFVSRKWYERIFKYICIKKLYKNYTNIIRMHILFEDIWIYEYNHNKILILGFRFYVWF